MNDTTQVAVRRTAAAPHAPGRMFGMLQREIDRLFDDFNHITWPALPGGAAIFMDLAETPDGFELTVEVPGMEEKDVKVTLADRLLTVSGEKSTARDEKDKSYRLSERSYGAFSRSIELPSEVDSENISASLNNGVLKISAPRTAKAATKQIEIRHAA